MLRCAPSLPFAAGHGEQVPMLAGLFPVAAPAPNKATLAPGREAQWYASTQNTISTLRSALLSLSQNIHEVLIVRTVMNCTSRVYMGYTFRHSSSCTESFSSAQAIQTSETSPLPLRPVPLVLNMVVESGQGLARGCLVGLCHFCRGRCTGDLPPSFGAGLPGLT